MRDLFERATECLRLSDPAEKLDRTLEVVGAWKAGELQWRDGPPPARIDQPGRLASPKVVGPRDVAKRGLGSVKGRAALIHALAHIELTAVNLAWDTIDRYRGMPREFYDDWVTAAADETAHFVDLRARLRELGFEYGDFPVHLELWKMAIRTADDLIDRMAIVHRVFEARALDVVPRTMKKLERLGDVAMVRTLTKIANDEIGHVNAGTRWYHYRCEQEGLEPDATFFELVRKYMRVPLKGPFNREARLKSGFSPGEMRLLEATAGASGASSTAR